MKKRTGLFLFVAFLAACNNSNNAVNTITNAQDTLQEEVTDAEVAVVKQSFPQLFAYLKKQDPTFSEDSFLLSGESRVEPVAPAPVDTQHLKPFQKYLIYNGDSSLALDLYSYNYIATQRNGTSRLEEAGPDTEVAVIDFKANLRRRVFFGGPSHTLWDAQWRGPQDLLLIGAETGEGAQVIPTLWHINLQDTSVQVFAYQGTLQADIAGYRAQKLGMSF